MNEKEKLKISLGFNSKDFFLIDLGKEDKLIRLMPYLEETVKLVTHRTNLIESQVKEYQLENRVYFLEDNEDYFKIANLGVVTNSSEEKVLKTAMLLQLPLLVLEGKENEKFIKNEVTGYCVNDLNEMINMIHFLKNNKKYNYNLGMNSYYFYKYKLENNMVQI